MENVWIFGRTAITAVLVDFLDPALAGEPEVRERGVRLEVRPVEVGDLNTIYSSPAISLMPAIVRIDLLESAPHRADRMHFHPGMVDGEPEDRTFDEAMRDDPLGWLRSFLKDLDDVIDVDDVARVRDETEAIVGVAAELLSDARQPWPEVTHDERGLVAG